MTLIHITHITSQVDDVEVDQKVRRNKAFEGEIIPERFYKLPRIK